MNRQLSIITCLLGLLLAGPALAQFTTPLYETTANEDTVIVNVLADTSRTYIFPINEILRASVVKDTVIRYADMEQAWYDSLIAHFGESDSTSLALYDLSGNGEVDIFDTAIYATWGYQDGGMNPLWFLNLTFKQDSVLALISDSISAIDSTKITDGKLGVSDIASLQTVLNAKASIQALSDSLTIIDNWTWLYNGITAHFGETGAAALDSFDLNANGEIDVFDVSILAQHMKKITHFLYSKNQIQGLVVDSIIAHRPTFLTSTDGTPDTTLFVDHTGHLFLRPESFVGSNGTTFFIQTGPTGSGTISWQDSAFAVKNLTGKYTATLTYSKSFNSLFIYPDTTSYYMALWIKGDNSNNTANKKVGVNTNTYPTRTLDVNGGVIADTVLTDYLNITGATKPHTFVNFAEFSADTTSGLPDTVLAVAGWDNAGLGDSYFSNLRVYHPEDTSNVDNYIRLRKVFDVPFGMAGVDSIVFNYRTGEATTADNHILVTVDKYTDGNIGTNLDASSEVSNTSWTHNTELGAFSGLARYEKFIITVEMKSKSVGEFALISRMIIYWKEGS